MPEATEPKPHVSQSECAERVPSPRGIDRFVQSHELTIIVLLCIMASMRVFVFSAAFPPFGNVDESPHYSMVCDYAEGHIPTGLEAFNSGAAEVLGWYSSPEYMTPQETVDAGMMRPPLDELPAEQAEGIAGQMTTTFMTVQNNESTGPPAYYSLAAVWYRLGEVLGLTDIRLAYWIRFLGVILYGLFVWTSYAFLRRLYPANLSVRVGVPLMLAFFPQDVFYQINSDVLTPLLFTLALYSLLRIYLQGSRSYGLYLVTGLSVAGAFLVKFSNVTIFLPLVIITVAILRRSASRGGTRTVVPRLVVMLSAAAVPVGLWLLRNCMTLGDVTGSREKIHFLGWVRKPLGEIFNHPVFTPVGAWQFLSELTASFWRGEMVWHRIRMAMPAADMFYIVSSLLFVLAAVAALLWKRRSKPDDERYAGWMGLSVLATSVALMLAFSIMFDFGTCAYPSTDHPYFTSGRLIIGALVPFLVLYVTGLDFLMERMRIRVSRLAVLLVIVTLVTVSEILLSLPVFASAYNWFHL